MSENASEMEYGSGYEYYAPCQEGDTYLFDTVFLPILYSLVFIVGFAGNSLVLCVLIKHRNQINLTDIGLFNLATSDLLIVLTLPLMTHYLVAGKWTFGDFICRVTSICHRAGFFSSTFFMIFMTLDRYMVILHAFTVARYRTCRAGIVMTVVVWVLSFTVSLPSLISTRMTLETYGDGCLVMSNNLKVYNLFAMNILGLVLPMFVMIACYSRIIPRLVNMRTTKRHRVIRLIICIMLAFFLCWAPYNIYLFLDFLNAKGHLHGDPCEVEKNLQLAEVLTETFAYSHCCLNPIIYAFIGEKFMKRVLDLLKKCFPCLHSVLPRDLSESFHRKGSVMSRSSDVTSTLMS